VAGVAQVAFGGALGRRWPPLAAGDAAALCVAGVALGDIRLPFTWQAWHLVTSTFVSCGRRGTWRHLYLRLAWQARHKLHLVARLVAVGRR